MEAEIARQRGGLTNSGADRAAGRASRMQNTQRVNWVFRIALAFSLLVGAAWGFSLGVILVRVNAQLSTNAILDTAMPLAFAGSMFAGLVFNQLVRAWHKVARLLAALVIVAAGMAMGLMWEDYALQLNAAQLVNATGSSVWYAEWLIAIAGLIGGMWPIWTLPFLRLLAIVPLTFLDLMGRFFEGMGHVFLWAPSTLIRAIARPFQGLGQISPPHIDMPNIHMPQPAPRARSQPRTKAPRFRRPRSLKPKAARNHSNNGNGNGLRVMSVVEDRCPYCLDIVKRNDPRGVRVCEVCGTPHHADCWSITGKCQVPHLNT